ncbi:MAG: NADH-quinone oxidoreductase subunit C [Acidimicrobiaceae bacterium]|nr:NADH-quinone oxidoreductase subunit C [Acidimicrobiaceae bacterium]
MSDETAAAEEAEAVAEEAAVDLRFGAVVSKSHGDVVLHASVETYLEVCSEARADGFDQLIDLTAVDYLTYAGERALPGGLTPERFEVVTSLINHVRRERIRIRTQVSADEPTIPSLFDLWPGSEYLEREAFDMFGITFSDHPDMSRVLMPEDWVGHPLRKDYAVGAIPVQFKAASNER